MEAEAIEHDLQNRRDNQGSEDHADNERYLLLPRSSADELTGLEVLQVVIGNGGNAKDDGRGEERVGHQRQRIRSGTAGDGRDEQRGGEHGDDADGGNWRVRRTNQAGHVATHGGDNQAYQQGKEDGDGNEHGHVVVDIGTAHKVPQQQCDRHHERHDGGGDIGEGNIALGDVHGGAGLAGARGG